MNRSVKLSLFCLGIFACGAVAGGFGARRFLPQARPQGMGQEGFGPSIMRKLTNDLALTEAQRAAIDPAIQKAGDELRELRKEGFRQSSLVVEAMDAAVASQLTPEQLAKFTILKEAQKLRMKAMMEERQRRREGGERDRDPNRPQGEREPKRGGQGGPPAPPPPSEKS